MSDKERLVTFEILGQQYRFYTSASEDELEEIFSLVRSLVEDGSSGNTGSLLAGKMAMMACLNIASRYVQLQHEHDAGQQELVRRLALLAQKVGDALASDRPLP